MEQKKTLKTVVDQSTLRTTQAVLLTLIDKWFGKLTFDGKGGVKLPELSLEQQEGFKLCLGHLAVLSMIADDEGEELDLTELLIVSLSLINGDID